MKKLIFVIVTACCFFAHSAKAQDVTDLVDASFAVYAGCLKSLEGERIETPDQACACITGYMGAKLNDREYVVLGYIMEVAVLQANGASDAQIQIVVQQMMSEGYTLAELQRVSQMIDQFSTRGDAVCAPFQLDVLGRTT